MNELEKEIAEVIWHASRNDEGTISATGANIVARALVEHFQLRKETCCERYDAERAEGDYKVWTCSDMNEECRTRLVGKWSEREGL